MDDHPSIFDLFEDGLEYVGCSWNSLGIVIEAWRIFDRDACLQVFNSDFDSVADKVPIRLLISVTLPGVKDGEVYVKHPHYESLTAVEINQRYVHLPNASRISRRKRRNKLSKCE